ncbi:DUF5689 domain-containing protein [Carboxylicivirga sp. N1Y90]|uniref:DUF5689 domain-containing protein n=1 Tax=Carboxylicivirga fragile TaxID=3417571 RepID=UPI003D325030|nr:lamin tail domain-containing protein [Marinilabiliaceae bacterium N1Y90]
MKNLKNLFLLLVAGLLIFSCSDDAEAPKEPEAPGVTNTIAEIKALATGDVAVEITEEKSFDGVVISNQGESGNFYKAIYVQDETGAIKISCDKGEYETYTIGQKVIVHLQGLFVANNNNTYLLGSAADPDYKVALIADADVAATVEKVDGGVAIEPTTVTIDNISADMVGSLIKLEEVQVLTEDLQKGITSGLMLSDKSLNRIKLYVSSYADGLKEIETPQLSGSIAAILYQDYDGNYSLTLRLESEIVMADARFDDGTTAPEAAAGVNEGTYTGDAASDLFFSEYIEGGSNNKYLEIFNGTGAEVDLADYAIKVASNGKQFSEVDFVTLSGKLPNGANFVIANSGATLTLPDGKTASVEFSTATYFNGDDALGLFKNETLIDIFGVVGEDPGSGWEIDGTADATKDHTLIRKSTVQNPATTWNTSEWEIKDKDDVSNIGSHTYAPAN